MKPAFLILAHQDQPLLEILVKQLLSFGSVHIHLDQKSDIPVDFYPEHPNLHIYKKYSIRWGHWSMVEATNFLAESALASGATYLNYLSGITLPIVSNSDFRAFLNEEANYFEANLVTDEDFANRPRHFQRRFTHRYIAFKSRRNLLGRIQRRLMREIFARTPKLDFKKMLGDVTLAHGIGFWSVTSDMYRSAMKIAEVRPSLVKYFKITEISDETYFQSLFRKVAAPKLNTARTFVDWGAKQTPEFVNSDHLKRLRDVEEYIFARKFTSSHPEVISEVQSIWNEE